MKCDLYRQYRGLKATVPFFAKCGLVADAVEVIPGLPASGKLLPSFWQGCITMREHAGVVVQQCQHRHQHQRQAFKCALKMLRFRKEIEQAARRSVQGELFPP